MNDALRQLLTGVVQFLVHRGKAPQKMLVSLVYSEPGQFGQRQAVIDVFSRTVPGLGAFLQRTEIVPSDPSRAHDEL